MEQCDDGNDDDYDECKNDCTVPATCGDGITQPAGPDGFLTPEADRYGEAYAASDDEECDAGPANGNVDYQNGGCKANCKLPECSNGRPEKGLLHGGTEWIEDAVADAADGGCHEKTVNGQVVLCDLNAPYMKGKESESNPCQLAGPGDGSKSVGETCSTGGECAGNSNGSVLCINTYGSQGTCTQVMSSDSQGANLLAQGVGGAPAGQFPQCPPIPGCNMMVGDPVGCAPFGGLDKDTCASQVVRRQCLQATAQQQCVNGVVVPVPLNAIWSCSNGAAPNQQWMCGPAGQWFCKCPNGPMPPLWQENLQPCPPPPAVCGDKHVDPGEDCDDGNQVDDDACSNACKFNGGACRGNECDNPAAIAACKADGGKVCKPDNQLPCIKCVPPVVGLCSSQEPSLPNECENGGNAFCKATGEECSLTDKVPCIACIPPNQCGNGRIDLEQPTEVDQGCSVTGTSNQLCMPEGLVPDDFGMFQPSDQCYQGAHCQNSNGSCSWEMTPELQQCLQENGGGLPQGCFCQGDVLNADCPVRFSRNPCEGGGPLGRAEPTRLAAQIVVDPPVVCPTDIKKCCGDDGRIFWVDRDPVTCQFPQCSNDFTKCGADLTQCVQAGCNGSQCVPLGEVTQSPWCGVDPKAACYAMGTCGKKPGGGCGWLPNAAFDECMNDNTAGTCPTDASCVTRAACDDSGGSAGGVCGADDTNVCCSGGDNQPDGPVEQCDDGNQIDGDACGNDCEINCTKNSDCPEGACVNGQCVDQCVEPDPGDGGANAGGDAGNPPAQGCDAAFPLCQENDPIVGIDNQPCPAFHHVEMASGGSCGTTGTGKCYRCIPDICAAVPIDCVSFCSATLCTTGCCGKDPATGQCGCNAMPSPQGSLPTNDFLSRLMAQQVPGSFRLLP